MSDQTADKVTLCLDGKYRWVYEMSLIHNATIPLLMLKVLLITIVLMEIILLIVAIAAGEDIAEFFVSSLMIIGIALLVLIPMGILGYLIYSWHMGWYYCVVFEMDENGVLHAQQENQVKKAGLLSDIAILAGLAAGNPTTVGSALLAKTNNSMYTDFGDVIRLRAVKERNVIYINNNQVYVRDEDFDFVFDYIKKRCPKVKS